MAETNIPNMLEGERMERAGEILSLLKQLSVEKKKEICEGILELVQMSEQDQCIANIMEEHETYSLVIDMMIEFQFDFESQEVGCTVLSAMLNQSDKLKQAIFKSQATSCVMTVIEEYEQEARTMAAALELVLHLSRDKSCRQEMLEGNVKESIINIMKVHKADAYVQGRAFAALKVILLNDSNLQFEMMVNNEYEHILSAMETHKQSVYLVKEAFEIFQEFLRSEECAKSFNTEFLERIFRMIQTNQLSPDLLVVGYRILRDVAPTGNHGDFLLRWDVLSNVTSIGSRFPDDVALNICGCNLIAIIAENEKTHHVMKQCRAAAMVVASLRRFPDDVTLQTAAFTALARLGDAIFIQPGDIVGIGEILVAMETHGNDETLQEVVCTVFSNLVQHSTKIFSSEDEQTYMRVKKCLYSYFMIQDFNENVEIFTPACSALYSLGEYDSMIKEELIKKGIYIPIREGLRIHIKSKETLILACRVLRGSILSSPDVTKLQEDSSFMENLIKVFFEYHGNVDVAVDVIAAIEALVCRGATHHLRPSVYDPLLEVLKSEAFPVTLKEGAIQAVSTLSKNGNGSLPKHTVSEILDVSVGAMAQSLISPAIQRHGLILLKYLADSDRLSDTELREKYADRIFTAMRSFPDDTDIQLDGWTAIKALTTRSETTRETFTLRHLDYESLFNILFRHLQNERLISMASECVSNVEDLKSLKYRMLQSATSKGNFEGVQCLLQLGADVNAGEGEDTPLCNVCRRNDKEMADLILKEDIVDMRTPLSICTKLQNFDTAATLLQRIGVDREDATVTWKQLWLDNNHLDKILPHMMGRTSGNSCTDRQSIVKLQNPSIECFRHIRVLDLSDNSLVDVPVVISEVMPVIEKLFLQCNKFQAFPMEVLQLEKLNVLNISHNMIHGTRQQRNRASNSLKYLNLSDNDLTETPAWLYDCFPQLESLDLSRNKISTIPRVPLEMQKLKVLKMAGNRIPKIPSDFFQHLCALEEIELNNNVLELLPNDVAVNLENLRSVDLSNNKLVQAAPQFIPNFILDLPRSKEVNLDYNGLVGIPPPILWKTKSLQHLKISYNKISKLDLKNGIENWKRLKKLTVSHNELKQIPDEIGQLRSLQVLDLSHNRQIRMLPNTLGNLNKYMQLNLRGLRLDAEPEQLRGYRTMDIISFLHERQKKSVPNNRLRLMAVGLSCRGKTTLLKRLQGKSEKTDNIATVGVDINEWCPRSSRRSQVLSMRKNSRFCLSVWDFAGQEDFYSTHPIFLCERSLYLVTYNASLDPEQEIKDLRQWLVTIYSRSPQSPVILVGTHEDELPKDNRDEHLRILQDQIAICKSKYPDIKFKGDHIVNSLTENEGIRTLREEMFEVIDKFELKGKPVIGQMIPNSYKQLGDLTVSKAGSVPILKHQELLESVEKENIDLNEDELSHAVRFLDQAGVLLHYEDPALHLRDHYFIDPEWLCKIMARVVTVREINPFFENGLLKEDHLPILLKGFLDHIGVPEYKALLNKFEIAIPNEEGELLVPCKMPTDRPRFDLPYVHGQGRVNRVYKLMYIPLGFWSKVTARLILFSRTIEDEINESHHWRTGFYVCWSEESYSCVEEVDFDTVNILIPFTSSGSRLLGEIVDIIDDLIEEWYPGLCEHNVDASLPPRIQRLVPCPECQDQPDQIHYFTLEEIAQRSNEGDVITCPNKKEAISLNRLAPDVVLTDLEDKFKLKQDELKFDERLPSNFLGRGAFGVVSKGKYENKDVAVKRFTIPGDHADEYEGVLNHYRALRREITILRKVAHPSIVSMVGIERRQKVLVMEFAPYGSLDNHLFKPLERRLRHRIALEVAEGLAFLHNKNIIYRDLKPENILLFSLSLDKTVTMSAKISDYGISAFVTPLGLMTDKGSPMYQAPEVRGGNVLYDNKVDVYSFGIVLHQLLTNRRPSISDECDSFVETDDVLQDIASLGCPPWPDMERLITLCTKQVPEQRPTSEEVFTSFNSDEMLGLRRVIPLWKQFTVESAVVMDAKRSGGSGLELWCGGGERLRGYLTWSHLRNIEGNSEVVVKDVATLGNGDFTEERIESVLCVDNETVVFANLKKKLWICDCQKRVTMRAETSEAVISLQQYDGWVEDGVVFAGQSNGQIAVFSTKDLKSDCIRCEPREVITVANNKVPIRCMTIASDKLWLGCGRKVFSLSLALDNHNHNHDFVCEVDCNNRDDSSLVTSIAIGHDLWLTRKRSSAVEVWNLDDQTSNVSERKTVIDCESIIRTRNCNVTAHGCRVKSIFLQQHTAMWIGTYNGYVLLVDPTAYTAIAVMRRHTGPVAAILASPKTGHGHTSSFIVTVGIGFCDVSHNETGKGETEGTTYALIWDGNTSSRVKAHYEYRTRRRQLHQPGI